MISHTQTLEYELYFKTLSYYLNNCTQETVFCKSEWFIKIGRERHGVEDCVFDFRISNHWLIWIMKSLNFLLLFVGKEKKREKLLEIVDPGVGFEKGRFDAPLNDYGTP